MPASGSKAGGRETGILNVTLLPVAHGDAIWVEYGQGHERRVILIDGGPAHTYQTGLLPRLRAFQTQRNGTGRIELFVVTHIDADHIDGAIIFLQDRRRLGITIDEVWFNGWEQLPKPQAADTFAPLQGEFLSALIKDDSSLARCFNKKFGGDRVHAEETDADRASLGGSLKEVRLPGGARLTLLGPLDKDLLRLRARWSAAIRDFVPGDTAEALRRLAERRQYRAPEGPLVFATRNFGDDRSPANGSSISFLLEYGNRKVLLTGDAHARTLATTLKLLCQQRGIRRLQVDAVKLPHHGSMGNISDDWLRLVDSPRWLVSTNGDIFNHPDPEIAPKLAEVSGQPFEICCNYDRRTTRRLEDSRDRWKVTWPPAAENEVGCTVELKVDLSAADR